MRRNKTSFVLLVTLVCFGTIALGQVTSQVNSEGYVVLSGEGVELLGIDLISAAGNLVPDSPGDLDASASPFAFTLSNAEDQVTYGNLTDPVLLDGELVLGLKYAGDSADFAADMSGSWGGPVADGTIAFVPEPNGYLMALFAVIGLLGWRRR